MMKPVVSNQPSLLSFVPLTDRAKEDLKVRMTQPLRFYHNLRHLEVMWRRHLQFQVQIGLEQNLSSVLIAAAIAYHDAVYVPGAHDNEERSADLWLEVSATATNFASAERLWVADTIRATADHLGASRAIDVISNGGYARQWVLDLDLAPLGEDPDVFDRNMDLLRAEAAQGAARSGQSDIKLTLRQFASAQPLYHCQPIAEAFGAAAQRNFSRHLA